MTLYIYVIYIYIYIHYNTIPRYLPTRPSVPSASFLRRLLGPWRGRRVRSDLGGGDRRRPGARCFLTIGKVLVGGLWLYNPLSTHYVMLFLQIFIWVHIISYIYTRRWFGTFVIFHFIYGIILRIDELIFFRGVGQPPTRVRWYKSLG
jgi:hypothetical protein